MFDFEDLEELERPESQEDDPVQEELRGLQVEALPPAEQPLRSFDLPSGVRIDVFVEGDGRTFPKEELEAEVVGRLGSNGCAFEGSEAKGLVSMKMIVGKGAIIAGMELALPKLSLGATAGLHIPPTLGYGSMGVPGIVPPNADLYFLISLVAVDGQVLEGWASRRRIANRRGPKAAGTEAAERLRLRQALVQSANERRVLLHPHWFARVERPQPSPYYLSVCRLFAPEAALKALFSTNSSSRTSASAEEYLLRCLGPRARALARKTRREAAGGSQGDCGLASWGGAAVVAGVQEDWRARRDWDLEWFQQRLGDRRQFVKWQGPVFKKQEGLSDCPVWEVSLGEYLDYVRQLEVLDQECKEENAHDCPRLYLNGWPGFKHLPWLREYVVNPGFFGDCSGELIVQNDELRELFLEGLTQGHQPPLDFERQKSIDDEYWELTKIFISPRGALTRLHYDNGGAHGWLSQVKGRKLFICFAPEDTPHLHAFEGDEGLTNCSFLDPLDDDAADKWPNYLSASPRVAVVEEGETIVIPQGWWHYAVALDTSITVMRNFYTQSNKSEMIKRKDEALGDAIGTHVLKLQPLLKDKPDSLLKEIARKSVAKIRAGMIKSAAPSRLRVCPGGKPLR